MNFLYMSCFTAVWPEFTVTLITLLIFGFYLVFPSHTPREGSVSVYILSKVRDIQLWKVSKAWFGNSFYQPHGLGSNINTPRSKFSVLSVFISLHLLSNKVEVHSVMTCFLPFFNVFPGQVLNVQNVWTPFLQTTPLYIFFQNLHLW